MMIENENDNLDEIRAKMKKEKDSRNTQDQSRPSRARESINCRDARNRHRRLQESAPLKVDHKQTKAALKSSSSMSAGGSILEPRIDILSMPWKISVAPCEPADDHYRKPRAHKMSGTLGISWWQVGGHEEGGSRGPRLSTGGGSAITSSTIDTYRSTRHAI